MLFRILLLIYILVNISVHAIEIWERPEVPTNVEGRYKLETERANLNDKIIEAEKAKEEGKTVDETDLRLKRQELNYIDTALLISEEKSQAKDQSKISKDEATLNEINEKITKIEQEIESSLNPANGSITKPNFIETAYLKVKQFFKERQLKSALAKNADIVQINRLQTSLNDIYTRINDIKAKEKLENLPLNFRPEAIKNHLQRFHEALNKIDPDDPESGALKNEISQYVDKYVKKIIESGIEFDLENARNKEDILSNHKTIDDILKSLGVDKFTRDKALKSITDTLAQVTPEAIKKAVTDFFSNKGTNTREEYEQLKQQVAQDLNKNIDLERSSSLKNLEKTLKDLYQISSLEESLSKAEKKELNSFLSKEYNDLSQTYAQAYDTYKLDFAMPKPDESIINAINKANISKQRATKTFNNLETTTRLETQKLEQNIGSNPELKAEIEKNKIAKPLDETTKKLGKTIEQNIHSFQLSFEFNLETANKNFQDQVLKSIDEYSKKVLGADPSREALDSTQKAIDSIKGLIDTLYDHAEYTPLLDSEKNMLGSWITELINKTYTLNQQKAEEIKNLYRELPNGTLIELPQSVKNPVVESPKKPENKAVFDAIEQQIIMNKPKDYKQLYDQVIAELKEKQDAMATGDGGF